MLSSCSVVCIYIRKEEGVNRMIKPFMSGVRNIQAEIQSQYHKRL